LFENNGRAVDNKVHYSPLFADTNKAPMAHTRGKFGKNKSIKLLIEYK
jgi:hypothetical protein